MDLIRSGARALAGGARRGNPGVAALGTALLLVGWMRRRRGPRRRLLYARTLRPGEALRIRLVGDEGSADPGE
ncbi:MAG: hypothetical protein FJW79_03735 [Actinobacteria bacterium]|nr:hypothetical protein [Actinomycetota bacterium]